MSNVVPISKPEPQIEHVWIAPDDVPAEWDLVLPGVEEVAQYGDHWRPEDVYMALRQGASHLHVVKADGRYAGFVVTTPSRGYDGPTLHVWIAYAVPGGPPLPPATVLKFREWAAAMNARRVVFTSPRKGWERLARRLGFAPTLITYELEV